MVVGWAARAAERMRERSEAANRARAPTRAYAPRPWLMPRQAANPALVQTGTGEFMPAPFANEAFVLRRPGCGFEVDNVRTRDGK